jgi:hypothetical protein
MDAEKMLVSDGPVFAIYQVASIAKIMAADDVQGFREQVHALRSAAANIGARGIYAICPAYGRFRPRIWPTGVKYTSRNCAMNSSA